MGAIIGLCWRILSRQTGPELYDRHRTAMVWEREPLRDWILNEILYSWPMDVLDRFHLIRSWLKRQMFRSKKTYTMYSSAPQIPGFVDFYQIPMEDFVQDNPSAFRNFNEFFIREVRPERRPVAAPDDDSVVISSSDCRLTVFDSLCEARRLFIKGSRLDFHCLLGNKICHGRPDLLNRFNNDSPVANFRLHPMDYHRFHAPVSGKIVMMDHIEGECFTVKSKALQSDINVFCENMRTVALIETAENGAVLFIAIGAENVGSVRMSVEDGADIVKGDEIGMFQFGGSDILVVFERAIRWDRDLAQWSGRGIETLVQVNERIGVFTRDWAAAGY